MKLCAKCQSSIPKIAWIDGKRKNFQRRKYCLKCSPFGLHNTSRLEEKRRNEKLEICCNRCNKPLSNAQKKGRVCWKCYYGERSQRQLDKAYSIVGEACWKCGYDKGRQMLDFHHVDPASKCFSLDARGIINFAWDRVIKELRKCALLCCRCHREYEYGFIPSDEIDRLYVSNWKRIDAA